MADQGHGISGAGVAIATAGGLILYAALTNQSILAALRDMMAGKTPKSVSATPGNAPPVTATDTSGLTPGGIVASDPNANSELAVIVFDASTYIGTPYAFGKANPRKYGSDCSGLVNWVLGHDGKGAIPGYKAGTFNGESHGPVVAQWYTTGLCVTVATPQEGDLVIWTTAHMGIYAGAGQMIHAPDFGQNVKKEAIWNTPPPIYRRYLINSANKLGYASGSQTTGE